MKWDVTPDAADTKDTIKIFNSAGDVVDWFFTSCGCQNAPGSLHASSGTYAFEVERQNSVRGGYRLKFFPSGSDAAEAADSPWIDWHAIGW